MGTYVNVYLADVRIRKDNQEKCLETLHTLLRDMKYYTPDRDALKDNLTAQLDWFGFSSHDNGDDIELEEYTHDKSGEEQEALKAIAPFVIPGGYVSLKYEDDASFGWTYEDDPENNYISCWSTIERTMSDKYRIERVGFTLMDGEKIYPLNIGREQILKLVNLLSEEEFDLDKEIKEKLLQIAADRGL